jgi:hypothetical protein
VQYGWGVKVPCLFRIVTYSSRHGAHSVSESTMKLVIKAVVVQQPKKKKKAAIVAAI